MASVDVEAKVRFRLIEVGIVDLKVPLFDAVVGEKVLGSWRVAIRQLFAEKLVDGHRGLMVLRNRSYGTFE